VPNPRDNLPPELLALQPITERDLRGDIDKIKYEQAIVTRLCSRYHVPTAKRTEWARENERRSGIFGVNLLTWYEHYAGFPIRLGTALLRNVDKQSPLSLMFRAFEKTIITQKYLELLRQLRGEWSGSVGLVFNWPHLAGAGNPTTGLVIHNRTPRIELPGFRMVWTPRDCPQQPLVIEHLETLLASLDADDPHRSWLNT
jgi:hypothetical protein